MFGEVDSGVGFLGGLYPLPVQICPREIAPIVPYDDSVNIEHGHYLEDEVFTQTASSCTITQ